MAKVSTDKTQIEHFLNRAVENIYPGKEKLGELLSSGQRITVYLGVDPTGPALHIGHAISMRKLATLQKLGHKVILLIGDFTAMIGDPTDKNATRKQLTREEVLANCASYKKQAQKILNFTGTNPAEMKFNSEWLAKMSFADVVELASHFTVQQMLERDMFEKRIAEGKPVGLHEFMYPLMQGYDSIALDVELEVGGNDQTFNMLAGRTLMREIKKKEKFVLTCKLLEDSSGKKMGKTEGNMITLVDAPEDMYGKVMSWTDGMIAAGFELCTDVADAEIKKIMKAIADGENPVKFKHALAREIVKTYIGEKEAGEASENFVKIHKARETPEDIKEFRVSGSELNLVDALVESGLVTSKTEARRQIEQGGIKVDEKVVTDAKASVKVPVILQKGKRHFIRLIS